MKQNVCSVLAAAVILLAAAQVPAAMDHSQFITGPFASGSDVTKKCLECHDKQAMDVMQTSHWKWKGAPRLVKGMEKSKEEYGKINLINNFCISVEGGDNCANLEFCSKCHPGYGMTNRKFDFTDKTKVDCLVCHTKDPAYKKGLGGQPDPKAIKEGKLDLVKAAQSVGKPDRNNCGVCHFFGGGGDAVKHGDIDSTLSKPTRDHDIHMGTAKTNGLDMSCQECHKTKDHKIAGASTFLATFDARTACEDCHSGDMAPHKKSKNAAILNGHLKSVACQTCHIPVYAKGQATKMSWDWADVGKDIKTEEEFDKETFAKHKGTFTWGMNVVPTYAWYNGQTERYLKGQKVDPKKVLYISKPVGSIKDQKAKIFPFKVHTGRQPMDTLTKCLITPQTHKALWADYQWEKALSEGVKGSGLTYSGKFEFVKTAFYGSINHEVAPKEKALQCGECHMGGNRLDWKALGYAGDPLQKGGRFSAKK